jgi:hypothetical protein
MKPLLQEVKDLRLENLKVDLKNSLERRKILSGFVKKLKFMEEELDDIIKNKQASSQGCQRLIGSIKSLYETIAQEEDRNPDITDQTRELLKILKKKYPEELKRMKLEIEDKLIRKGIIGNEEK